MDKRFKKKLFGRISFNQIYQRLVLFLSKFSTNWKYGLILFFSLNIIIVLFVFHDYILCKKLYLFKDIGSDTINISLPHLIHLADYLRTEGLPKWSFNQGMGQNIYPFSIGEPFNLLLVLLGRDYLPFGIVYVEILKIFFGGLFFFLFLREMRMPVFISQIGGLFFAFSGFMILGGGWYQFSTEAVYCSLLLYSLERSLRRDFWMLLPIPIALIGAYEPFNLFMYGLLIFLYTVFRVFISRNFSLKLLVNKILIICVGCLIGVGVSSIFLFSNVLQYLQSPRVGGYSSYSNALLSTNIFQIASLENLLTATSRFFSSDLLGTGSYFRGYKNYLEAPIFYCGLLNLLIIPQIFHFAKGKHKVVSLILLLLAIVPLIFPFFRYAFWLFIGDYYRTFSFFIMLIILFGGVYSLYLIITYNRLNLTVLFITFIFILAALYSLSLFKKVQPDGRLQAIIVIFLILYLLIISCFKFHNLKYFAYFMLMVTVSLELASMAHISVNNRPVISTDEYFGKSGYNDYSIEAINYIKSIDNTFFRVNKAYSSGPAIHGSINDAKIQKYHGTSSYDRFNQEYYIKFLAALNIIDAKNEFETKWSPGLTRLLLQTFGNVKYYLTKNNKLSQEYAGYSKIAEFGDVSVFKNNLALPLGLIFSKYVLVEDFIDMPVLQKDITLLNAFVIEKDQKNNFSGFNEFNSNDVPDDYYFEDYKSNIKALRSNTLSIQKQSQNFIAGSINVKELALLLFTIPFDKGWVAKVDGKKEKIHIVDIGLMGIKLNEGFHEIELSFSPPLLKSGSVVSIISLMIFFSLLYFNLKNVKRHGV